MDNGFEEWLSQKSTELGGYTEDYEAGAKAAWDHQEKRIDDFEGRMDKLTLRTAIKIADERKKNIALRDSLSNVLNIADRNHVVFNEARALLGSQKDKDHE